MQEKKKEKNYPQVSFNVAFTAPREIQSLFPFKDKINSAEKRSLVVYHIKCKNCTANYIGKTERILSIRINEHRTLKSSACHEHMQKHPGHIMDFENVEILDSASSDLKLKVKERIHIVSSNPSLNKQLNSQSGFELKTFIVALHPRCNNGEAAITYP